MGRRRDVDGISDLCNTGRHGECQPACKSCTCHPRPRPSGWPGFGPTGGGCGMIVTHSTDDAA